MISCSLGSDGIPTEGDTCVYQCNDGYVVSGDGDRECQSDNTWTGSEAICERGEDYSLPENMNLPCKEVFDVSFIVTAYSRRSLCFCLTS